MSEETKAKIGAANRGKKRSAEFRAQMSIARLGKRRGPRPEVGPAISAAKKGKPQTAAHREANRRAHLGQIVTEKHRAKLSAALKGRKRPPFSDEWRKHIGNAGIGRVHSIETRAKRSASLRRAWEEGRHPVNKSYRYTSLAQQLHQALESQTGVTLEPEVRFGRFTVDLYDRENHVAYEADGTYWHQRNESKYPGYHQKRDEYLAERFGLTIRHYTEHDIAALRRKGAA